jgi:YidC/Oxa1 family membrane protein insertase
MFSDLSPWMQYICIAILALLRMLHSLVSNWGISIILLALVIRILLFPLSQRAAKSQKKFNEIQKKLAPEIAKIKSELKGAEQSEAILQLYKTHNTSPLASLKPLLILLIQLPIFIALYHVLKNVPELQTASFLWVHSLAQPDQLFHFGFKLPMLGEYFNALPILMTISTLFTMKVAPAPAADKKAALIQNIMMTAMALTFLILFYSFPSGMVLYWTMANIFMMLQTLTLNAREKRVLNEK